MDEPAAHQVVTWHCMSVKLSTHFVLVLRLSLPHNDDQDWLCFSAGICSWGTASTPRPSNADPAAKRYLHANAD